MCQATEFHAASHPTQPVLAVKRRTDLWRMQSSYSLIVLFVLSLSAVGVYAEGEKLKHQAADKGLAPQYRPDNRSGRDNRAPAPSQPCDSNQGGNRNEPRADNQGRHGERRDHDWGRDRGHDWNHRHPDRRPDAPRYNPPRHEPHRHPPHYSPPHTRYESPRHYVSHLPFGFASLLFGGLEFFYYAGDFYRPYNEGFVVVGAPLGAVVSTLPYTYSLLSFNNRQYYVVNDTYYVSHPQGYQVVSNPVVTPIITAPVTVAPGFISDTGANNPSDVYPQNGQTASQQAQDEYQCHRWGVQQSGFDPLNSAGIVSNTLTQNYQRAKNACLESLGYAIH